MKNVISLIIILLSINVTAQKHDYIWLGGAQDINSFILDFNYPNDSIYGSNRSMMIPKIYSAICNKDGHLLFYTNGIYIADSSHQTMLNGDGLNPGQIAQMSAATFYPTDGGELALPVPQKDSLYQLFHSGVRHHSGIGILTDKIYYTTINVNLNNGKGAVIAKNQLLLEDTLVGKLSAVQHGNGIDWWILTPELFTNGFYTFLLTSDSIYGPFHQQVGPIHTLEWFAQNSFSPDGKKYARYDGIYQLDLFDFDRCTGLLSNPIHIIPGYSGAPGLGFSPNSRFLYASAGDTILQYDILASDIAASGDTVAIYDGFADSSGNESYFYRMQLAPNGKIYINSGDASFHIIHSPDSSGMACNVEQRGLSIPTYNVSTTPNYPHFRTGALAGSPCDTLGVGVDLVEGVERKAWIYPNPTDNQCTLTWQTIQNVENGKILIFNSLGQLLNEINVKGNNGQEMISLSNYPSGVYILKLYFDGNEVYQEKLIIAK